ncbi:MAG: hypothetical protein JXR68_06260, partial [Bacteroidales bacterium]|nr:hypothetical protein [Bacteroidales bacterium]
MPEPAKNIDVTVKKYANLNNTIDLIVDFVNNYSYQVADLAKELKGKNDFETGFNVWKWVKNNIEYVEDSTEYEKQKGLDVERVRTPARTIADKKGDCDCMTVLVCSLLKENNIKPFAKIVAYPKKDSLGNYEKNIVGNLKTNGYGHIYSFFYYKNKQIFIDTVPEISEYNTEHFEPIVKHKIIDIMELRALYGVNAPIDNSEILFDEIILGRVVVNANEKGTKTDNQVIRAVAVNTLKNFRNNLQSDVNLIAEFQVYSNHENEVKIIDSILNAKNENELTNFLIDATQNSKYAELYEDILNVMSESNGDKYSFTLLEDDKERLNARINNGSLEGIFNRKNPKANPKQNKFFATTKKITLAPARSAFLQLIKLNFLGMGEKLIIADFDQDLAQKNGITNVNSFKTAKTNFVQKWENFGGTESKLNDAIQKSRAKRKLTLNGLSDLENEMRGIGIIDPVTASTAFAATAAPVIAVFTAAFKGLKVPRNNTKANKALQPTQPTQDTQDTQDVQPKANIFQRATGLFQKAKAFVQKANGGNQNITPDNIDPDPPKTATKNNSMLYLAIGIAVIAIVAILFFATKNKELKGIAEIEKQKRLKSQKRYRQLNGAKRKTATPKRKSTSTAVAKRKTATPKRKS